MKKIVNDAEHAIAMARIDSLMTKGSDKLSKEELAELHSLALAVQAYELVKYESDMR